MTKAISASPCVSGIAIQASLGSKGQASTAAGRPESRSRRENRQGTGLRPAISCPVQPTGSRPSPGRSRPVLRIPERSGRAVHDLRQGPDDAYLECVSLGTGLRDGFGETEPFGPVIEAMAEEMARDKALQMYPHVARPDGHDQDDGLPTSVNSSNCGPQAPPSSRTNKPAAASAMQNTPLATRAAVCSTSVRET